MESIRDDRIDQLTSHYQWHRARSPAASVPGPQRESEEEEDTSSSSASHEFYLVGHFFTKIIGVRYYSGNVSDRLVGLVREPLNRYDPNSIEVFDARNVKVGHLERSAAAFLSPLIDEDSVKAEGTVFEDLDSSTVVSRKKIICKIDLFSRIDGFVKVKEWTSHPGLDLSLNSSMPWKKKPIKNDKSLDEIFKSVDVMMSEGGSSKALKPPSSVIKTELFDHQKEGLGWLVHRENSDELPPFWEEEDGLYVNVLTNVQTDARPRPIRGGIFADEMGLGKTLTLLSLIAYDKCDRECESSIEDEVLSNRRDGKRKRFVKRGNANGTQNFSQTFDDALGSKTTLVVFPPSLYSTWLSHLEEHTETGSLKVYEFYGDRRTRDPKILDEYDIVLTTYSTLAKEKPGVLSAIWDFKWRRVILDEGHSVRNVYSQMSAAVSKIKADSRWVVTGTPIQNGTFDLFSMMVFLKFEPFSIRAFWRSLINKPISEGNENGLLRLQAIMATISLRRTKEMVSIGLPDKSIETYIVELLEEERKLYDILEEKAKDFVSSYKSSSDFTNYSTVLALILQLRQICNSENLCQGDIRSLISSDTIADVSNNPELLKKLLSIIQDGEDNLCPICQFPPTEMVIACCAHIFCRDCILKALKVKPTTPCPFCRRSLSLSDLFSAPTEFSEDIAKSVDSSQSSMYSSKVTALIGLLSASRAENPKRKSVIFSQFPKMLLLLEEPLKQAGFVTLRLDGTMDARKRAKVVEEFGVPGLGQPTILLASLRTSSEGINLTAASRVYLFEPWCNPAVEEQAMDRVHRIGQKEDVKIVRLIARNTIEERVLVLQKKKRTLSRQKRSIRDRKEVSIDDFRTLMAL